MLAGAELTVFTLHLFLFWANTLRAYLHTCCSIDQPIPSAAMFCRDVRPRKLVELPSVVVVEVCFDDSMFRPPVDGLLVDAEAIRHLLLVQHSPLAKPIIARTEAIGMHEIRYVLGRKAISPSPRSRGCAWAEPSLVEHICDFRVDVRVEQLVDQFHDLSAVS